MYRLRYFKQELNRFQGRQLGLFGMERGKGGEGRTATASRRRVLEWSEVMLPQKSLKCYFQHSPRYISPKISDNQV